MLLNGMNAYIIALISKLVHQLIIQRFIHLLVNRLLMASGEWLMAQGWLEARPGPTNHVLFFESNNQLIDYLLIDRLNIAIVFAISLQQMDKMQNEATQYAFNCINWRIDGWGAWPAILTRPAIPTKAAIPIRSPSKH